MATPLFQVERPGLLTTVQDLGRVGFQRDGIVVGGVMDPFAAQIANILVGNPRGEAVLEITLLGPTLQVLGETRIAVCGADLTARVDQEPLPLWRTVLVKPGQTIRFGTRRTGTRAYLAVTGGFSMPFVLGSKSTFLRAGMGGHEGRALRQGDVLEGMPLAGRSAGRSLTPSTVPGYGQSAVVRIVSGPHSAAFDGTAMEAFFASPYAVTSRSDRMGYRLEGARIGYSAGASGSILSEAAPPGGIQIPPDGQPILLMADRQTTGGYPLIGVVASADLPRVAQAGPGDSLGFQPISLEEAHDLVLAQERLLRGLEAAATWDISGTRIGTVCA